MKIRKSFRLSSSACNQLSVIAHHFGTSETSILENAISGIFVFFRDFSGDVHNDEPYVFEAFCDAFGYTISHSYHDF